MAMSPSSEAAAARAGAELGVAAGVVLAFFGVGPTANTDDGPRSKPSMSLSSRRDRWGRLRFIGLSFRGLQRRETRSRGSTRG